MTRPSFFSSNALALLKSFNDETSNALSLLSMIRFRIALRSPCAGRLPVSPVAAFLPFFVFNCLRPFLGAAAMPFFVGPPAYRVDDVEKKVARGAVAGRAAASMESRVKLRGHIEGGMMTMWVLQPL